MNKTLVTKTKKTVDKTVFKNTEAVFIYVGPNNKLITRYTVFKNGYPPHLKEDIEKFPLLKNMFIHPAQFADFEKNVKENGTVENIQFNEVKKYFDNKAVK